MSIIDISNPPTASDYERTQQNLQHLESVVEGTVPAEVAKPGGGTRPNMSSLVADFLAEIARASEGADDLNGKVAVAGMHATNAAVSAADAEGSANSAAAVVTGGTGALTPEAGKLPVADAEGHIDHRWLGSKPRERWFAKLGAKFQQAQTGKCRIVYAGTSIAAGTPSPGAVWASQAAAVFGTSGDQVYVYNGNTAVSNGWIKQTYGGPGFTRQKADNTATPVSHTTTQATSIIVRYGTELDGGTWSVSVDDGTPISIDSNGPQSYRNELVISGLADTHHKLTLIPPTGSGFAYIEGWEAVTSKNGVTYEDLTFGGSAIGGAMYVNQQYGTGDPIQVEGYNGIDAFFARGTVPDIFVWQYTVNDAGNNPESLTRFTDALDRAVELCRENDIPLILIIEPFGHFGFELTNDPQIVRDNIAGIYKAQIDAEANNEHVYLLDWHKLIFVEDIVKYTELYYWYVTLSNNNQTYSGDFIHPAWTAHYIAQMALCAATGLPYPLRNTYNEINQEVVVEKCGGTAAQYPFESLTTSAGNGSKRLYTDIYGRTHELTEIDQAVGFQYRLSGGGFVPVYSCDTMVAQAGRSPLPGAFTAEGEDEYGPYVENINRPVNAVIPTDYTGPFTVTYLMRPLITGSTGFTTTTILCNDPGFIAVTPEGEDIPGGAPVVQAGVKQWREDDPRPVYVSATYRRGTSEAMVPSFSVYGRVYGSWVTLTPFPVVSTRLKRKNALQPLNVGFPVYTNGDPIFDRTLEGQEYIEAINGKEIKAIAIAASVHKINGGQRRRLYRLKTEAGIDIIRGTPINMGSPNVEVAQYGGLTFGVGGTQTNIAFSPLVEYGIAYAGKTYTFMFRPANDNAFDNAAFKLYLQGANNYGMFASLDLSGNVIWTEYAGADNPASVGDVLTTLNSTLALETMSFTTVMPPLAANMGSGPITPRIWFGIAGNIGLSYLVEGSRAAL